MFCNYRRIYLFDYHRHLQHKMSIMEYNGGSVVAMRGKKCVAIAGDLRLGNRNMSLAGNFEKVGDGVEMREIQR